MMKQYKTLAALLAGAMLLSGCAAGTSGAASADPVTQTGQTAAQTQDVSDSAAADTQDTAQMLSEMISSRDCEVGYDENTAAVITLTGSGAQSDSDAVQISGSSVTITDEGTYILRGTLTDGQILVNAEKTDKLQIVLDGADICSGTSAALYILQADKVFLTTAQDSQNRLSNGGSFVQTDGNNVDAAVYSKEDLTLNGTGSLTVESPAGHGVVSKDDLVVTSGTYTVTAAKQGLSGKDSIRITGGSITVTAGKDAIHAENNDDTALGFVYLAGGTLTLDAQGDGISASGTLNAEGGTISITAGGGSRTVSQSQGVWSWGGGSADSSDSAKGLKAAGALSITGGTFTIDSADDALHTDADLTIAGGSFTIATGDDALHADGLAAVSGGTIAITASYEGIEGAQVEISGGEIRIVASDDGINASGGADQSGFGGFGGFGGNGAFGASGGSVTISGGVIHVNASGDGIDVNGSLTVSGGETYVSGPTDSGNGALDYDGTAVITGGVLVAAGSAGMAMNVTEAGQGSMLLNLSGGAGSTVTVADSTGRTLVTFTAEKRFETIVISCPELVQGGSYTVTVDGSSTQVTLSSLIYGSGQGAMGGQMGGQMGPMGGMGGQMGGQMGGRPGQRP